MVVGDEAALGDWLVAEGIGEEAAGDSIGGGGVLMGHGP